MRLVFILILSVFFSGTALADTFLDICQRGRIGDEIARAVSAGSCKSVSKQAMNSLTFLQLEGGNNVPLTPDLFSELHSLRHLILYWTSGYNTEPVPAGIFKNLPNLEELALYINKLPAGIFEGATSLRTLSLAYVNEVDPDAFRGLENLGELAFLYGKITKLHDGIFRNLNFLTLLSIGTVENVSRDTFLGLKSLQKLIVNVVHMDGVVPGMFADLSTLKELEIGIKGKLPANSFEGLTSLDSLFLTGPSCEFSSDTFQGLKVVQKLRIDTMPRNVPAGLFRNMQVLYLDFDFARMTDISSGIFDGLDVKSLDLGGNQIQRIANGALSKVTGLRELRFAPNYLGQISRSAVGIKPDVVVYGVNVTE